MAYNAGDVESKLDLDRSPFITGLKAALAEAEAWKAKANKALKATADIDAKPFNRSLTAMQASLTKTFGKTYTAKVRIDDTGQLPKLTELNKRLTALAAKHARPKVTVEVDDKSLATLGNRIAQLGRDRKINIGINLVDFSTELAKATAMLDAVARDREIFIDVNWSRARASLKNLELQLGIVTRDRNINIDINVSRNGITQLQDLGGVLQNITSISEGGAGGLDRYQKKLLLIGSAITVAAAPALGVLSTALATIPFLAGAGAASFAVLQMGFDNFATAVSNPVTKAEIERKKAALANLSPVARQVADIFENELKPAFGNLQHAIQDKIFQGVGERFRQMITLMPQLRQGLLDLAGGFNFIGNAVLDVIVKSENLKMIGGMLSTFAGHITNLAPAFANLTQAFLTMANVGNNTFGSLVSVINTFAADFNRMINIMTQTGVLQGAFQQLAAVTGALLYAFNVLMESGFKAMVAIGPSLSMFIRTFADLLVAMMPLLTQISVTFMDLMIPALDILIIVFNKLGPPIIKILDILGQALVDAINGLMPFIDALATQVGDILMAAVNAIVPILPDLVKAIVDLGMALIPVVNQVGPLFVELIKGMAPLLPPLSSAFLQIVDALLPLIPMMMDMAMVILPPLIAAFVQLAKIVGPVMQIAADIIGGLIKGLVGAIGLIYNAISFVVNGMINFFKTILGISSPSTIFLQFGIDILQGLINGLQSMLGGVVAFFLGIWNAIRTTALTAISGIVTFAISMFNGFVAFWTSIWTIVSNFFSGIWRSIQTFAAGVIAAIVTFFITQLNAFNAFWSSVWNAISNFFSGIWRAIQTFAIQIFSALVTFYQTGLSGFSQFWSNIWNAILQFFSTIWNNLKLFAMTVWTALVQWYMAALNAWNLFWTNIWNTILNFFISLWNNLKNTAIALWNTLRAFWDGALNAFSSFWSGIWENIKGTFDRVFSGIIDIAKRIWDTVKNVFRDSINAVIRGVNWPIDKINGLFGINIPKIPEIGGLKAGGYVTWDSAPVPNAPIGPVRGPGGPKDDKVLTRLSNKEHVWSAAEVKAAGGHEAVAMMRKNVLAGAGANGASTNPFQLSGMGNSRMSGQQRLNLMKRPNMDDAGNVMLAFGGVKPHVAEAGFAVERALGKMPGGIGGVGARGNVSDHPSGHALDFMTLSNTGLGDRVAGFLTQGWGPMSVKYLIWKQRIAERPNAWSPMENRGSVTANHFDHVHASFLGGHDGGSGFFQIDYGAIFDSLAGPFKGMGERFLRDLIPVPPVPQWIEDMGVGLYNKGWEGIRKKAIELMQTVVGWLGGGGGGNVEQWRPAVLASLARVGQPASMADMTLRRMNQESGGNPRAINNWDSNARKGTPSKGLMQVIDPTFRAHRDPGLPNDIWDPMANIVASMRYTLSRYGSLPAGYNRAGGYDSGGILPPGWTMAFNGTEGPEVVLTAQQWQSLYETARDARQMVNNHTYNSGVSAADIEQIIAKLMAVRPMIGTVQQQLPQGTSSKDLVDELTFELRHITKGMYE